MSPGGVSEVDLMVRFEVNEWDLALGMAQEQIVTSELVAGAIGVHRGSDVGFSSCAAPTY